MDEEPTQDEVDGTLYDRFALAIFTYICQHLSNRQDAEDLLVEVFLAAFKNDGLSSLPVARQLAWLLRVTRNKLVDRHRHHALLTLVPIELASEVEDGAPTPEQYAEQQESYECLYRALEQLSPLQRELVWLRHTKSLRFCDIACKFEKSEVAVRQLYSRTLQQLRGIYYQTEGGREAAMKPFDERQPEEQNPQYDELITLLEHASLDPILVDPHERTHILSQARARLFPTDPEIFKLEHMAAPALRELGSFPSTSKAFADKPLRGRRLLHVLNLFAAVLVVAVLLGGSLFLFQHRLPSTRNHVTNATQTYASFVAKNGIMFGFNAQHTNANPFEQILNPKTVGHLTKKWAYQTRGQIDSSPAVTGNVVYVGSADGNVYALDAASGAKKWAFRTGNNVASSPAVAGGVVYFSSTDDNVYALDAVSGAKKWAYRTGGQVSSSPAVVGGVVYVGSNYGVYALDATSGAKKWAYRTRFSVASSPAVAGGMVYVGSYDGIIYAFDAASGAKKWTYPTGGPMGIGSSPTVAGGVVYVGSTDGNVYALDATSGAKKWAYRTGSIASSPAVAGGVVYVGSMNMNMYAFHLPGT